ncbi:MAG TPA: nucleoside monophosphate kinase [Actinomycetes bacterium]|nr:nucleoside monophosphate kinase [Actinomycetes bacterium]
MRKYIIMGVQGSGKGTQAKLLADTLDLEHISVGDIFRWNVQHHTKLGAQVRRIVAAGELVPDELVEAVVHRRLDEHDWNFGFIIDGFPRSQPQARFFLESYDIDAVILLEVADRVVADRILSRRLCSRCGLDYNLISHRPAVPDVCDMCGGRLVARPDDTPEAVRVRLRDYHARTRPILDLFRAKEFVVAVDAVGPPEAVHADIRLQLGLERRETGVPTA